MQWVETSVLIAGSVFGVAAGLYGLWHWTKTNRIFNMACPTCGKRLHYVAKSRGHQGICPRCSEKFTFPK